MARTPDAEIDRLFQLPLTEFTAQRNALAKRTGDAAIRTLQKPNLPAWSVNQLFWRNREVYDELVARAEDLRVTHQAALRGRSADVRGASRAHDAAVDRALKATLALVEESGQPVTEATRQAILTTLRALPSGDAPGRLAKQLQPRGFEALAAATAGGRVKAPPPPRAAPAAKPAATGAAGVSPARLNAARRAVDAASRAVRDAEGTARRLEFEVARAHRDADKARRRVDEAEEALRRAQEELEAAREHADIAARARTTAEARAQKAAGDLEEARTREDAARRALAELT